MPARLHLKVNTGMDPGGGPARGHGGAARRIAARPELELEALWTHSAVADESPGHEHNRRAGSLDRFEAVVAELDAAGLRPPLLHAANSAATIEHPHARFDLVRCGIAVYGVARSPPCTNTPTAPGPVAQSRGLDGQAHLHAGERISYGLRHEFTADTTVATVPIGYADGVPGACPRWAAVC